MTLLYTIFARNLRTSLKHLAHANVRSCSTTVHRSPYPDIEIPNQTATQFIWSQSAKWDDLPAVTCGVSGRSYTYGVTKMLSSRGAKALLEKIKLKPGNRVGLILPNLPEYPVVVYAAMKAGLVVTFANPLSTTEEIARQFSNAEVRCIMTIPQLLEAALTIARTLPDYAATINIGGETDLEKNVLGMQTIFTEEFQIELPDAKSTDIAILPYSSGTTGLPKGVMLSHRNLVANLIQCSYPAVTNVKHPTPSFQETVLSVLPFFHIYGFNGILNFLMCHGVHIVTIPRFTPEDYLGCLVKYKPTTIFLVPSLLLFLATHAEVTAKDLSSIRRVICGAAPATKNLIDKFKQKLNRDDCTIEQGYGMTETSPVVLYTPQETPESKMGTCGRLLPSTEARLISLIDGTDITRPHKPGELLIRGPQLMQGYLNDRTSTKNSIDVHGWLHTGDVAYYDEDGYFFIVDRTKELIKVKGNQVSPTELEGIILEVTGVADVAVIGVPDTMAGELPKAFIVKHPGAIVTPEIINDYVTPKVAPYKKLAGGITFIEAIPRNPSGKVMRNQLKVFGK